MARPKKRPNYDADNIMGELMNEVSNLYLSSSSSSGLSIRKIADEFEMTPLKIRKILITAGVFSSDISENISKLKKEGKSSLEIQKITGLSRASVQSYLPYTKIVYNAEEVSLNAERIRLFRERKAAVVALTEKMKVKTELSILDNSLWEVICLFEEYPFYTEKGSKFTYLLKNNEMVVSKREQVISRSTVLTVFHKVLELRQGVKKPEKLWSSADAEYLLPVFKRLKVIIDE